MSLIVNFNARLGRDAEIKQTQNGNQYVLFPCAIDIFVNGKNETMWMNVTDFSDRTLKIVPYLTKGKLVNICGEYSDRIYTITADNHHNFMKELKTGETSVFRHY